MFLQPRRYHPPTDQTMSSGAASATHRLKVVTGTAIGLGVAALPLMNKAVRDREQEVAEMRDQQRDKLDKDSARGSRLSRRKGE